LSLIQINAKSVKQIQKIRLMTNATIYPSSSIDNSSTDIGIQIDLTEREKLILDEISQGSTIYEIADKLSISPTKAEEYITDLLDKTKTRNAAHLIMFAAYYRIISY
jgi:DNA-binding NarL/FixJ family response regulator